MLNILDVIFLNLTISFVVVGSLITNYEEYVPVILIKLFRYGSFAYKGKEGRLFNTIEVPKSYFRHFYVFSAVFSSLTLIYMVLVYYSSLPASAFVQIIIAHIFKEEEPKVSAMAALLTLSLLTLHCWRRCYESHKLQVFARTSKINVLHYGTAYVHYAALILIAVGQAPLFCGKQKGEIQWMDDWTKLVYIPCIFIFLLASYEQYKSNAVLANLRKDKTGVVVTEAHKIPQGRLFDTVSSPHRLCEIVLYIVLATLTPTRTMLIMCFWVFCNQIQSAVHAHVWYKRTFKDYPKNRKAILPCLL